MRIHRLELMVCLLLIAATIAVYWQLSRHDFVILDDDGYVTENLRVCAGFTKQGVIWAFTTFHYSNWHPLTWLSHMLDCQLFGLRPGMHHLGNLLLHIANTLLLFLVLRQMTSALWRSAFVAALFAFHPLHVESVAWVAERKDVLSTLFWLLTMWAYTRYAVRGGVDRYLLVLFAFALGLMAKPMLVTLPFVMLLLDYWPLGRLQLCRGSEESNLQIKQCQGIRLVWEKIPFFALSAVSSLVTVYAQQIGRSITPLDLLPLEIRIGNALICYVKYIGKMIWPHPLAVFYPHPITVPAWQAVGAGFFLICFSVLLVRAARKLPYLLVGWLWYLGTLMPVIGLVQVGSQAMADRYTYVPLIGLFIVMAWGLPDMFARWPHQRAALATLTAGLLAALMICSRLQVRYWQDSITLFQHALCVAPDNPPAHTNLGVAFADAGKLEEAIAHFSEALRIRPSYAEAHMNLGVALDATGRLEEAIGHFSMALRIKPDYALAHNNLGLTLARHGRLKEAIRHFSEAMRIKPDYAEARQNLERALRQRGEPVAVLNTVLKVQSS